MKLSPLDIRKHEFARKLRGYDPDEVRPFLEMLSQQWEEMQEEVRSARDRVREIESKIGHYEKVEVALQEALEAAKANASRTQTHAEERARLIIEDAELKAEQRLREAEQERFQLRQDVSKLTHRHAEITARLRHFLMSELEILAQHEDERPIGFMKLLPARDAETLSLLPEEEARPAAAGPPSPGRPQAQHEGGGHQTPSTPAFQGGAERETPASAAQAPEGESADASGTTYADLYARAARRARDQQADVPEEPAHSSRAEEDDEPAWTLRSLVMEEEPEEERPYTPEPSEKDHIRRILEDLD
jgi:cell division initiation protein